MTKKRKPLAWVTTAYGEIPDCWECQEWLWRPGMAEAIASVGIEHPVNVRQMTDQYHAIRHVEADA